MAAAPARRPRRPSPPFRAIWAAALLFCLIAVPTRAEERDGYEWALPEPEPAVTGPVTSYTAALEGVDDSGLREVLEASAQLFALSNRPPPTLAGLERRAQDDLARLQTALRSEGYYAAEVDYRIEETETARTVTLAVTPGPRYSLTAYDIDYADGAAPTAGAPPRLEDIGIEPGMAARAPDIVAAERKLVSLLNERGYPFARVAERKSIVRHETRDMVVRLSISTGALARFGALSIAGAQEVEQDFLRALIDWEDGEIYDRRKVDSTRRNLSGTGLFESVGIATGPIPDGQAPGDQAPGDQAPDDQAPGDQLRVPMQLTVVEGKHRTIGASVGYSTDVGPEGEVFWEHRNFLGENEQLRLSATGSFVEQVGAVTLRKPVFLERGQDLLASLTGGNRDTDAFDQLFVESSFAIERGWQENWRLSAGVAPSVSNLDEVDRDDERRLALIGLPLTAVRDTRDDLLDPTSGLFLDVALTPTFGAGSDQLLFAKAAAGGSAYYGFGPDDRFVLAGRSRIGSIVGERTEAVPADRRFYAGGGGSIRGYEFQRVGPLDEDNEPLGGRSLLELGGEVRVRLTEEIGAVPFIDGGTVFDSPYPDMDETLRWAAGLGVRYFTGFGPLRLDVAFPLNPRDDVDDVFQFYVSFGQAF